MGATATLLGPNSDRRLPPMDIIEELFIDTVGCV
jgi:hypothetical protein